MLKELCQLSEEHLETDKRTAKELFQELQQRYNWRLMTSMLTCSIKLLKETISYLFRQLPVDNSIITYSIH
jgi:hypothetical protein